MSVFHINLKPVTDYSSSYFGGTPHLQEPSNWPKCPATNEPMLHLLTLSADFFFAPTLKPTDSISIFVSYPFEQTESSIHITRAMAVNSQDQQGDLTSDFCKVLLHQASSYPAAAPNPAYKALPICEIERLPFSEDEVKEEVETPGIGLDISKFLGIPGWIQDELFIHPRYTYFLQLNEYDIRKISPPHEGIFREGMGYLYINNNAKKLMAPAEAGYFFIQFT